MADVKQFNIDGTNILVKDETARTTATTAQATATSAMALAEEAMALSRIQVSYDSNTETISFTYSE